MRSTYLRKAKKKAKSDQKASMTKEFEPRQEILDDLKLRKLVQEVGTLAHDKIESPSEWKVEELDNYKEVCKKVLSKVTEDHVCRLMQEKWGFDKNKYSIIPSLSSLINEAHRETIRIRTNTSFPINCKLSNEVDDVVKTFWETLRMKSNIELHQLIQARKVSLLGKRAERRVPFFVTTADNQSKVGVSYKPPLSIRAFRELVHDIENTFKKQLDERRASNTESLDLKLYAIWLVLYLQIELDKELGEDITSRLKSIPELSTGAASLRKFAQAKNLHLCDIPVSDEFTNLGLGSIAVVTSNECELSEDQANLIHDLYYDVFNAINKVELSAHYVGTIIAITRLAILHQIKRDLRTIKNLSVPEQEKLSLERMALDLALTMMVGELNRSTSQPMIDRTSVDKWVEEMLKSGNSCQFVATDIVKMPTDIAICLMEILRNADSNLVIGNTIESYIKASLEKVSANGWRFQCTSFPHEREGAMKLQEQVEEKTTKQLLLNVDDLKDAGNGIPLIRILAERMNHKVRMTKQEVRNYISVSITIEPNKL